jgi:hypothetical protein
VENENKLTIVPKITKMIGNIFRIEKNKFSLYCKLTFKTFSFNMHRLNKFNRIVSIIDNKRLIITAILFFFHIHDTWILSRVSIIIRKENFHLNLYLSISISYHIFFDAYSFFISSRDFGA